MLAKIGIYDLPILAQIAFIRLVITGMTGNAAFATPLPTLAAMAAAVDALEIAYQQALYGGKLLKETMYEKQAIALDLFRQLVSYVDNIAGGDPAIIHSANLETRKQPEPADIPAQVMNLRLRQGTNTGQLKSMWDGVKGRYFYRLQLSTNVSDPTQWVEIATTSSRKFTISGLNQFTNYWVRVVAEGSKGVIGQWSDPATIALV